MSQCLNASGSMLVVNSLTSIFSRTLQLRKASLAIFTTFLGMLIPCKPQSAKAPAPISLISASGSNFTLVILLHPLKALSPIAVTDLGKLNVSRLLAFAKAFASIVVRSQLPSKMKFLSFLFVANAESLIFFNLEPSGMVTFSKLSHS